MPDLEPMDDHDRYVAERLTDPEFRAAYADAIEARVRAQVAAEIAEAITEKCNCSGCLHCALIARQHATDDHQETGHGSRAVR